MPTGQGYPDQLAAMLQRRGHDLRLVKLGCSGETTVTLISGGICSYPGGGTQLDAATQFLRQHRGQVGLVTIDIGANDLNPCVALGQAAQIQSCLTTLVCELNWECVPPPQGPNEHANAAGYHVIAAAFLAALTHR